MRNLALGGLAGPVLFALAALISASLQSDYSHVSNFISELGATSMPNAAIMNYAGFVPGGLLLAGFGVSIGSLVPRAPLSKFASLLIVVFGAGVVLAGLFSCDLGCPQAGGSLENRIHEGIAPPTFLSAILGCGLLGLRFRRLPEWNSLWVYSVVSSGLALFFLAALGSSLETRALTGLWQRLMLATLYCWCAARRGPSRTA